MKYDKFTVTKQGLLCWRLGSMNKLKQKHFSKDIETVAGGGGHKPPVSRGFWAFPYPYYDLFYCFHQYEKHLPKHLSNVVFSTEELQKEYAYAIKKIKQRIKPSMFFTKNLYSHIFPYGRIDHNDWFYWDDMAEFARQANKTLVSFERYSETDLYIARYSVDHLEIFIP